MQEPSESENRVNELLNESPNCLSRIQNKPSRRNLKKWGSLFQTVGVLRYYAHKDISKDKITEATQAVTDEFDKKVFNQNNEKPTAQMVRGWARHTKRGFYSEFS